MKPLLSLLCLLVSGVTLSGLTAQTATVPNVPSSSNVDRPFAGGIGRYQQWFQAAALQAQITEPIRLEQVEFFAGTSQSSTAVLIDMEILMGHGKFSGLSSQFDTNYETAPVVVVPRQNVQLNAVAAGAVAMTVPFANRFTWDHVHPLVLEIRIHGNSLGGGSFTYNMRGVTTLFTQTSRVYQAGSPGATTGNAQQGVGMIARFTTHQGVVLDYGAGCAGQGGFVPVNTSLQIPSPAIVWDQRLSNAASQALALWIIGDSNTMIDTIPLPLDLAAILGMGSSNCFLQANLLNSVAGVTVGGGAGAGSFQFGIPLPATTSYVGWSLFTQWIVFDPAAPSGLAVSQGVHAIVAPLGG